MKPYLVGLCTLICGCGADDSLPARCTGESALEATHDAAVFAFDGTTSGASRATTSVHSPVALGQPFQTLNIFFSELGAPIAIDLPDARLRLEYSLNPNGDASAEQVNVATVQPTAANWFLAAPTGRVVFEQAGEQVGSRRCGSFDVTLRWTPVGASEETVAVRGAFDATVAELQEDRPPAR